MNEKYNTYGSLFGEVKVNGDFIEIAGYKIKYGDDDDWSIEDEWSNGYSIGQIYNSIKPETKEEIAERIRKEKVEKRNNKIDQILGE